MSAIRSFFKSCLLIMGAFIAFFFLIGIVQVVMSAREDADIKKEKARAAEARLEKLRAVELAPDEIAAKVKRADELALSGDFAGALAEVNRGHRYPEIKSAYTRIRTQQLEEEVRKIPASEVQRNIKAYEELATLNPESERYKNKVQHYKREKIKNQVAALLKEVKATPENEVGKRHQLYSQLADLDSKYKEKAKHYKKEVDRVRMINKQFSSWDGSHYEVVAQIKARMHDPGSFEHVKTTYYDEESHLMVTTVFRGRNAFGAKVVNTAKAMVVPENGNVIAIEIN